MKQYIFLKQSRSTVFVETSFIRKILRRKRILRRLLNNVHKTVMIEGGGGHFWNSIIRGIIQIIFDFELPFKVYDMFGHHNSFPSSCFLSYVRLYGSTFVRSFVFMFVRSFVRMFVRMLKYK